MYLGKWQTIFAHTSSIVTIVTLLLKNSLTFLTLALALGILAFNIYSIVNSLVNSDTREFKKKVAVAPIKRMDSDGKTIFNAR